MPLQLKHTALLKNASTLLAGQWVGADSGKTFTVSNSANRQIIASVPKLSTLVKAYRCLGGNIFLFKKSSIC